MMLDGLTLGVTFGALALTLLLLFYFVTYRSTRSEYCLWWCRALFLFLLGAGVYVLDGTVHQVWANPLSNVLLVAGAIAAWTSTRTLNGQAPMLWPAIVGLLITGVSAAVDSPATNSWAGGAVFLAAMAFFIGLAALALHRHNRGRRPVRALTVASAFLALLYLGRFVAFIVEGTDGFVFGTVLGPGVTNVAIMVLLVVVSFTITALSHEQVTNGLRSQAAHDPLTGVLNRRGFLERVRLQRTQGGTATLMLADLDGYKAVNDTYGHQTGDAVLQSFANACLDSVRASDLVGRYGGDEFIMLLPGASLAQAERVAEEISRRLGEARMPQLELWPTVSFGVVLLDSPSLQLDPAIAAADAALYKAKSSGRNRAVRGELPAAP